MARADISYDYADFGMSLAELKAKYGTAGHPEYTPFNWFLANENETRIMPYWHWVQAHIAADDDAIPSTEPVPLMPTEGQANTPSVVEAGETKPDDLVLIDNIDVFAGHISAWHHRQVKTLKHFLIIPPGTGIDVQIDGEPMESITLEGAARQAFRGGIATALNYLGKLPFHTVPQDQDPRTQQTQAAAPAMSEGAAANVGTSAE